MQAAGDNEEVVIMEDVEIMIPVEDTAVEVSASTSRKRPREACDDDADAKKTESTAVGEEEKATKKLRE